MEFTVNGHFVGEQSVDPNNGRAFGIGLVTIEGGAAYRFAAVDDNANTLSIWTVPLSY